MTLLAKALFDNLADAPDELSFRKGDIVTVIEQDVDGLVGWWLCLLHGRQGIAPGNRLKVLPSVEDAASKPLNYTLSPDHTSTGYDARDGSKPTYDGSEYDILPAPVKASHGELFESPSPKTLKDVYTSPSKSPLGIATQAEKEVNFESQSNYDFLPKREAFPVQSQMIPEELYDIPTSASQTDAIYDIVPSRRSIHSNSIATPNSPPKFQNALSVFTAIPDENVKSPNSQTQLTESSSSSLYDIPKPSGGASSDLYDYPSNMFSASEESAAKPHLKADSSQLYDIPTNQNASISFSNQENASAPEKEHAIVDFKSIANEEMYDVPVKFNQGQNITSNEIYDTPPSAQKQPFVSSVEIYDIPSRNNNDSTVYDTPLTQGESLITDFESKTFKRLPQKYGIPSSQSNTVAPSEIYDIPPQKAGGEDQVHTKQHDIYDRPSDSVDGMKSIPTCVDIYDTPSQGEIYDQPPKRALVQVNTQQFQGKTIAKSEAEDLYDIPLKHDVEKVMSDIERFKTTNQSLTKAFIRHQAANDDDADDDYVDYQDIYGKDPPLEMVKEMEKAPEGSPRVAPKKPARKISSLDQINMSAVKELKLSKMQAYERLNKLHLAVDTSISALVGHADGDWLNPQILSQRIAAIKDMSNKVKLALRLLTEFGLGAVVNAKLLCFTSEADAIKSDIEPLLESYYRIKVCLMHLDGCKWAVPQKRNSTNEKFFATVNAIMILAGRVPEHCRKLTSTLHFNVKKLFAEDDSSREEEARGLTERVANLKMKSNLSKSSEMVNSEKGKLKLVTETVNDKKVREILELDARPTSKWVEHDTSSIERANGADMSPMEMKQEFQSRRQKGYNSTLPRRPPVPPKPTLPTNRRSMAAFMSNEDNVVANKMSAKADTLVTDFITEDGRKKYASDPSSSPVEPEPARRPEWGGSCPQLDDHTTYSTPQYMLRATSSGTAASSTSTRSLNNSADDLDDNANLSKMASDSNLFAQTMITSRVTESIGPAHVRSASLPWDNNKIPFSSYEKQQNTSSNSMKDDTKKLSKLDHRDTEAIIFFLQRVESQVLILRDAVRNLTESVSKSDTPQLFVPHSKFVILTAHKVVHAGEELCGKLLNEVIKTKIKRSSGRLADSIRGVVAGTKQAALDYPNQNSLMEMMTTVLSVGESVREVHKEAKKALEL